MNTNISLPQAPKLIEKPSENRAVFEIEEMHPGYGLTVGNALRRIMLSSLPGSAIVSVKIKGVSHEFSTIPGVMEDIVELILNLKQVRFKVHGDEPQNVHLKVKGEKEVRGKDIISPTQVEVVNPGVHIATLTSRDAVLEMEMQVENGLGYSAVESRKREKQEIGSMSIDAIFSPIRKINYEVENMRVGDRTDYNRLVIDIETDGTIMPEEALERSANILIEHYKIIASPIRKIANKESNKEAKKEPVTLFSEESELENAEKMKIEDLKFSQRTQNALLSNHIKTVGGIVTLSEEGLLELEGLGEKAVKEIKKALGKLGLTLKQ
ncbi:DNA-directed RNA polymerase subunit alpha [Candidatus Azambacteria bacterium RIFCSPHIGHO2_01_FULL_44_55]|uniref:DNA-directed RNA polymerase subunit alpha n=1 Tax=Candidatus Azambacteria bacterium RIFCSPLOWO2_02_FULL_44_14 TaxID=1797306 RepID=A0A1F5CBV7_9BACT|nr:MAG: DNA-directed RNA polymerase subunit alpha [Candidatus Azambacteria bacterium RIFCSPLOWO2_01_FULL_44_84]OGD33221.1 MAG: DNA-directed RNA polymerase subunit alpha [Candidatus Azambacteria bacterium RIFCSPHIGHO2_02_FULL_45_18]OGD40326.1 MAG: DNA-directed RNA polymerase subunit alpha [Candidatus Azambacteria bacterium RIFCSPLOWO2_02_FULL_44_14]OGD40689.1 MAG: DNA-directed RNA polymerase subunit alpha [Candidatus Azambacteria bacterium RIFCSPHIGHO2_01_FULL_44_55]OGD52077.1 MAG: DNA-directed 